MISECCGVLRCPFSGSLFLEGPGTSQPFFFALFLLNSTGHLSHVMPSDGPRQVRRLLLYDMCLAAGSLWPRNLGKPIRAQRGGSILAVWLVAQKLSFPSGYITPLNGRTWWYLMLRHCSATDCEMRIEEPWRATNKPPFFFFWGGGWLQKEKPKGHTHTPFFEGSPLRHTHM